MVAVFAVAESLHPASLTAEKVTAVSLQTPASVASAMTTTIHAKLPIEFNANEQLAWAPAGSKCFIEYVTDVEISQMINGVMTYFQIEQTGHSLGSLIVKPINAAREFSIGSPLVSRDGRLATSVGDVSLGAQNEPVTEVEYKNNHNVVTTPVGVTTRMDC
jgi:hypothetical protein